jgi:hypothetical protein
MSKRESRMLDAAAFAEAVISQLPKTEDEYDKEIVRQVVEDFRLEGWTVDETVRYCRCLEHVDPSLDEATAITRMSRIRAEVSKRKEMRSPTFEEEER